MRHWKLNLAMMWFSQLLVLTGFAAAIPFIPLFFKRNIGIVDEGECGLYVSLFAFFGTLAYAIFTPIWGTLSDRYGVKIMLLRGTFLTAFIFPFMGYVESAWMLIFLRFLTAACAGTTAAAQTLIVKNTPDDRLGFALGIFSTAFWCGVMLGNVVGGLVVHYWGFVSAFWLCGILYFIGGISVLFAREDCKPTPKTIPKKQPHNWGSSLMPHFTIAVWLTLLMFTINSFVRTFEGSYVAMIIEQIGGEDKAAYWTGIISAFVSAGALLSGALFGYLADRLSPEKLILPALIAAGILLLVQAFAQSLLVFGAARTLMFITGGGLGPVYQKILSNITPKRKRGQVFGWTSTFNGIGNMSSSLCAGGLIYFVGTRGIFLIGAILTLLLVPFIQTTLKKVLASTPKRKITAES
ncbi:MAG: multidrug efflux MFS transporter [Lentisphaerae bacterium]|nr:multidrug efflux MFS transporter [Lentisphaerota bacterium]